MMEGGFRGPPPLEKTKIFPTFLESTWHMSSDMYLTCTILQTEFFLAPKKRKKKEPIGQIKH